jgi:hypothetical protein
MSWSIPTKIEEDFISGKAQYSTFQTGSGGQSILPVSPNSYIVIFGYDFSPAGGGFQIAGAAQFASDDNASATNRSIRAFETQQISFYTGQNFFPFIHHVNIEHSAIVLQQNGVDPTSINTIQAQHFYSVDNTPISRQLYITSSNDVTITHGLIIQALRNTSGAIPATNRTPNLLTYGGSGQNIQAQTDLGPAGTPLQFMQPSPKDFQDFGLGLLPNNASGQEYATPDFNNGLVESQAWVAGNFPGFINAAAINYFLNIHYALYTSTIPDQRG